MKKLETIIQLNNIWRVRHSVTPKKRWWLELLQQPREGGHFWNMQGVFVSGEAIRNHLKRMFKDDPHILSTLPQIG